MIYRADLIPEYKKYKKEIDAAAIRVLNSGRYILNDEVCAFEAEFASYNQTKYCLGLATGTDAIILALRACGIGDGDEVITTAFTAYATISAIISSGATPVFVDVCEDSYLLDIEKVKSELRPNTKAVLPVHLFGNVVDIGRLREIIGPKICIIEDAAQAHGSSMGKVKAGSFGDVGCFSFYPTKNLGGYGDGGAIITNNKNIYEKIKKMRMYGMSDKDHIDFHGINSRLDEIQAAILRVKLKYLDRFNAQRNLIAQQYINNLDSQAFTHQKIAKNTFSNFHVFQSKYHGPRDSLVEFLAKNNIQTNIYYLFPHHLQKSLAFLNYSIGDLPNAEKLSNKVIALPIYPELESNKIDDIVSAINNYSRSALSND
jgi:dTDP-4-amino-4,6-dideoxygalactose transaminase